MHDEQVVHIAPEPSHGAEELFWPESNGDVPPWFVSGPVKVGLFWDGWLEQEFVANLQDTERSEHIRLFNATFYHPNAIRLTSTATAAQFCKQA
jgi:hypothetical protein